MTGIFYAEGAAGMPGDLSNSNRLKQVLNSYYDWDIHALPADLLEQLWANEERRLLFKALVDICAVDIINEDLREALKIDLAAFKERYQRVEIYFAQLRRAIEREIYGAQAEQLLNQLVGRMRQIFEQEHGEDMDLGE